MSISNINLLIVDEENSSCGKELTKKFIKEGFNASFLPDGEQALKKLKKFKYDLLITGIKSSKIDGLELLRRIKASNYPTDVIIYTEYGDVDSYIRATKLGAADFVNKPMEFKEFLSIINGVLQDKIHKTKIETSDRRKHPRFSVEEVVYVIEKNEPKREETKTQTRITDISLSGIGFEYHSPFEINTMLEVHPVLGGKKIIASGKVRRSKEKEYLESLVYHTGIEIIKMSNQSQKTLQSYLKTI